MALRNSHETRLDSSIGIDTYAMSAEHPVIDGISSSNKQTLDRSWRSGDSEDKKRLDEIGSPAPSLGLAALEGLQKCDIGGQLKQEIAVHLEKARPEDQEKLEVEVSREDLQLEISFIRFKSCCDTEKMKLAIGAPARVG